MSNEFATDLALLDLESEFQADQQQALIRLQCLLLDEEICQYRIGFLNRIRVTAGRRGAIEGHLVEAIEIVGRFGVIDGFESGELDLPTLLAISCSPDAIWKSHLALSRLDTPYAQAGLTILALNGDWDTFRSRLGVYLPAILKHVGVSLDYQEIALDTFVHKARLLQYQRFRHLLPQWIDEFALAENLVLAKRLEQSDWHQILDAYLREAICVHVDQEGARPSQWVAAFARAAESALSWRQLPELDLPEGFEPIKYFPGFQQGLSDFGAEQYEQAMSFFELDV